MKQTSRRNSEYNRDLQSKIGLLDKIGFRSVQRDSREPGNFNFYLDKPKHETVHVTDLWSVKDKRLFLKRQDLEDAERERVKRRTLFVLSEITAKDRRSQDKFIDLSSKDRLPKLTVERNKFRNSPTERRNFETYSLYLRFCSESDRAAIKSPRQLSIDSPKAVTLPPSNSTSPNLKSNKLSKLNVLIDVCTEKMKSTQSLRHRLKLKPTVIILKNQKRIKLEQMKLRKIARSVKRLLDSRANVL